MRISVLATAISSVLIGLAMADPAAATAVKSQTNIAPQELSSALRTLASDRNLQILYTTETVAERQTAGAVGELTVDEALAQLLGGTGLAFRYVDNSTITIVALSTSSTPDQGRSASGPSTSGAGEASKGKWFWNRLRIAQAESSSSSSSAQQSISRDSSSNPKVEQIGEIVVIGSHIRGVQNSTAPITILDKEYIDSTGYSTVTQLIESLPQNVGSLNQRMPSGGDPNNVGNQNQGSSINLRAIGQGTTLILINGRRMAPGMGSSSVDISALPLSAIERVEILTDGASALYGSDAVGGVVNFVLREDFGSIVETRLLSGWADSVDEQRVSQTLGNSWESGNALLSMEYYKRDLLLTSDRDFVPSTSIIGSLLPEDKNYSAMLTGNQDLSETVSLSADALYTRRDSFNFGGVIFPGFGTQTYESDTRQLVSSLGLAWRLPRDWQLETSVSYARNDIDSLSNLPALVSSQWTEIRGAQAKVDGLLFELPGGPVRTAFGVEWRDEKLQDVTADRLTGVTASTVELGQIVRSAFTQIYLPIVGDSNAVPAVRRLEVSLAARHDDYSSFGSSLDPQLGLMWEPVEGLRLRGTGGTSYKPPNLAHYVTSGNVAVGIDSVDPVLGPAYIFTSQGYAPETYRPQQSESMAFGLEFAPKSIEGFKLGLNYYTIEYSDRIALPNVTLSNPAYASLVTRNPTVEQVNAALASAQLGAGFVACSFAPVFNCVVNPPNFDPASVGVLVDARTQNLSVTKTSGVDISVNYAFDIAGSTIQLGLNGTHIRELIQQVTSSAPEADNVDTLFNPTNWKARGSLGWQYRSWTANLFLNYVDSYRDVRTVSANVPVSSYSTVDARLAYDFKQQSSGWLSGVTVAASASNLLDQDPPGTLVQPGSYDMGYDPTNANPLGRFVAIELTKRW